MGSPTQLSISFVICYFGKWPPWFNIFLQTCRYNPTVQFLIFSDCGAVLSRCDNVRFVEMDLPGFNALASGKLGMAVDVEDPYKLCDFKPAYGLIFEDYLQEADFWGHCDNDIVFGNIRKFVEPLLPEYDVITAKKEYLLGSFTLFQNCPAMNRLFENSADYQAVFMTARHFCFDECSSLWWHLLAGVPITHIHGEVDSMTHVVKRLQRRRNLRAFFETLVLEQDQLDAEGYLMDWKHTLLWQEGSLVNLSDGQEYLYFHFHFLKESEDFIVPDWQPVPDRFCVTEKGFERVTADARAVTPA